MVLFGVFQMPEWWCTWFKLPEKLYPVGKSYRMQ